jgi:hypothetical protein
VDVYLNMERVVLVRVIAVPANAAYLDDKGYNQ